MATPADGAGQLRELDEHLPLHRSLVFLPSEVEYLDLFFPLLLLLKQWSQYQWPRLRSSQCKMAMKGMLEGGGNTTFH